MSKYQDEIEQKKITYKKMQKCCEIVNKLDSAWFAFRYVSPFYRTQSCNTSLENNFDIIDLQFNYEQYKITDDFTMNRLIVPYALKYFDKDHNKQYSMILRYKSYRIKKYYLLKIDSLTLEVTFYIRYLWLFEYDTESVTNIIKQFSNEETIEYIEMLNSEFILSTM